MGQLEAVRVAERAYVSFVQTEERGAAVKAGQFDLVAFNVGRTQAQ